MVYMGSKSKIAKYIVPIIEKCIKDNNIHYYYEPFIGGANIFDKIHIDGLHKGGSDLQRYLISLLNYGLICGQRNEEPKFLSEVSKEFYDECREKWKKGDCKPGSPEELIIAAVGFFASYNGRFYDGGYAKPIVVSATKTRCPYDEKKRNFIKQIPNLAKGDVEFFRNLNYIDAIDPYLNESKPLTLFYVDPPYANTKAYDISKNFNHEIFWEKMRQLSKKHYVIISELVAPDDFDNCLIVTTQRSINAKEKDKKKVDEKLFYYKEGLFADYISASKEN